MKLPAHVNQAGELNCTSVPLANNTGLDRCYMARSSHWALLALLAQ